MIKKKDLSEEDKKAWEDYTKIPQIFTIKKRNHTKFKKRTFKFDLHGFTLDEQIKKLKK